MIVFAQNLAFADPVDLQPFRATYSVKWKGITAGIAVLKLERTGSDTWSYSNTNTPRGIFRMALPDSINQVSTFQLQGDRIQPVSFRGMDEKERPIELDFDWVARRVSGKARGHAVDIAVPHGTQDPMSLQIASLRALAKASLTESVWLVDGDKVKECVLTHEGRAKLETELGEIEAIVYSSRSRGGDRITRTWVAPAHGFIPVKAERTRGKKVEFTIEVLSISH